MYARTIIYKIYSIILLVSGVLGGLYAIFATIPTIQKIPVLTPLRDYVVLFEFLVIISALLSMFFAYIEFSSMYGFTDMINHENSNSIHPMVKKSYVLPAKVYSVYGMVVFAIVTVVSVISCLAIIIGTSIATGTFISLPLIPLAIIIAVNVLYFINYFVRFKSFAVLLEITTAPKMNEPLKQKLGELNPKWLRGYCVFLAGFCAVAAIAFIVGLFFVVEPLFAFFGANTGVAVGILIGSIISVIISLICIGIFGCYVDNMAKMVEHYQIKHKII